MMDKEWENRLNDEEYKNWLKVSQALIHTKEALHDFIRDVIKNIHDDILAKTASSRCDGTCKTNKGKEPSCASCTNWVKEIKSYKKGLLNWKNTEPTKWHDVPWEIAKCFMNAQGSKTTAAQNTGPEKTDVSGIFNVLANCKEFGKYLKERRQAETVREIRNKVMHSPTMSFSEDEMKSHMNCMITFLEDELYLKKLEACKTKVRMLESLRDGEFQVLPEVEIDCLEGALESHALLLESGGEVDEVARGLFNALSRLTKNQQDLKMRTDRKFSRMADHFETRMASIDFSHGELKGKVEWLEKRLNQLERGAKMDTAGATWPSDEGQHDKSWYKNSLQCYAQKKKLGIPKYSHEKTDLGTFISTVSIADREFKSEEPKASKKEADQRVAEMALRVFTNEASDENKECDLDPPTSETPTALPKMQKEKSVSYKNKLQEIAQERKIVFPSYETEKTESGLFLSKVFFDGVWYTPGTEQARKKQDAEQKAAEFVLAYLESKEAGAKKSASSPPRSKDDSSLNIGKKVSESACRSSTDSAGSQLLTSPSIDTTIDAANSPNSKKSFISKLNEFAQQQGQGIRAVYKDIDCTSGFHMEVTVKDMTFQGEVQSSKKEAKEMSAKKAWNGLNMKAHVSRPKNSSSSPNSEDSILLSTSNCESSVWKDSATKCSSANAGKECSPGRLVYGSTEVRSTKECELDPSTSETPAALLKMQKEKSVSYKNKLQEIAQERKIVFPSYETKKTESGLFLTEVFFDCVWYTQGTELARNEQEAEQKAAEFVLACLESKEAGAGKGSSLNIGKKVSESACRSSTDSAGSQLLTSPSIDTTIDAANSPNGKKSFKSKLNEFAQQQGQGIRAVYKAIDCTSGFRMEVTVKDMTFQGEVQSSKKEAKEMAAKIAWNGLNVQTVSPPKSSSSSPNSEDSILLSTSNCESSVGKDSATKCSSANAGRECSPGRLVYGSTEVRSTKECDLDPSTSEIPAALLKMQKEESVSYKNKLEEIAQERKIVFPSYETEKTESGLFLTEVFFDCVWYTPGTEEARNEQEAEQKAAEFVLACLESKEAGAGKGSHLKIGGKNVSESGWSLTDSAGSQLFTSPSIGSIDAANCALEDKCSSAADGVSTTNGDPESVDISDGNSIFEIGQPCESDGHKTYRSKLNEHRQSVGSDKVPYYEDIICDSGFRCKVTVLDKTYEGTSPQKSKKEAKEQAARQAYLSLELEQNSGIDNNSPETSTENVHVGQADVVQDETFVHDRVPISKKTTLHDTTIAAGDSKDKEVVITQKDNQPAQSITNFKGKLVEHTNQSKITPWYVTKSVDETKEFVGKVFLGKRCFKGEKASKRKEAEQNAAKVALEELQGADSRGLSVNCEALLKEYHENIEAKGHFPKYEADADGDEFVAMATVVKKWKVSLGAPRAKKRDAEEGLAEEAIKLLENEKKFVQAAGTTNCRSRLNQFCQLQKDAPGPNYNVVSYEQTCFSGDLSFYTVEMYESLCQQPSKDEAITSAARSACNDLDLI